METPIEVTSGLAKDHDFNQGPFFFTSARDSTELGPTLSSSGDTSQIPGARVTDSPSSMSMNSIAEGLPASSSRRARFGAEEVGTGSSTSSTRPQFRQWLSHRMSTGVGDDVGPRFSHDPADQDSKALPGTAGNSGVYRGDNVSSFRTLLGHGHELIWYSLSRTT